MTDRGYGMDNEYMNGGMNGPYHPGNGLNHNRRTMQARGVWGPYRSTQFNDRQMRGYGMNDQYMDGEMNGPQNRMHVSGGFERNGNGVMNPRYRSLNRQLPQLHGYGMQIGHTRSGYQNGVFVPGSGGRAWGATGALP